ncbi:hypothetical protein FRX31_030636 [Thalictrum thalictroides]|uniref:Uncharacterized protein n=1 Tax=Thalictrum thalictroides TaxID=46969 RepID=A0A7J6V489_THATH|nr:hypothetical protein FRX31_030636 [Thalictrum thalictroides]
MGDMDLGSCILLLVLLICGTILQISYVGKGYVTALKSSSEEITDENQFLGYSFTGPIHYEVMNRRRTKATPPPPHANIIRGVIRPPYAPYVPPPPDAPFPPPPPDAPFLPSCPPPPEEITPPSY